MIDESKCQVQVPLLQEPRNVRPVTDEFLKELGYDKYLFKSVATLDPS